MNAPLFFGIFYGYFTQNVLLIILHLCFEKQLLVMCDVTAVELNHVTPSERHQTWFSPVGVAPVNVTAGLTNLNTALPY